MAFAKLSPEVRLIAERELTRKQLDVLKLWLAGAGTTRISVMLGVSDSTVRGHLRRAFQKLQPYMEEES